MTDRTDLSVGPIPRHVWRIAVPAALGITFITLYNVVDNLFAGLLATEGLAVLALSTSALFLISTLGLSMNTAMVALVGNAIGAKDFAAAKRLACQGISYAVILSAALTVAALALAPALVSAISVPGELRELTRAFLNVAILSAPSFILSIGANGILVAQGDPMPMLRAQIASFIGNVILNPLFMFGIPGVIGGLGIIGIAASTLACQTGVSVFILWRVLRSDLMRRGQASRYRPERPDFGAITGMFLPVQIGYILMVTGIVIVQVYLKGFGPEAIAAFGAGLRVEQVFLLPALALAIALRAIASQNVGAGQYDRVREVFRLCCGAGAAVAAGAGALLWMAGGVIMTLFSRDPEVIRIGHDFLKVYGALLPARLLLFSMNSLLQAFKRPAITLCVSMYQEIVGITVFIGAFVAILELQIWGVWLGVAASVVTALLLAFTITARVARRQIEGLLSPVPVVR